MKNIDFNHLTLDDAFGYTPGSVYKFKEGKDWLSEMGLRTPKYRKLCKEICEGYAAGVTPNTVPCMFKCIWDNKEGEAWYAPLPKKSESLRGFESRFRAWLNLFMAYNTDHDKNGWILPTKISIIPVEYDWDDDEGGEEE